MPGLGGTDYLFVDPDGIQRLGCSQRGLLVCRIAADREHRLTDCTIEGAGVEIGEAIMASQGAGQRAFS